jgi:hypothetical protein
MINSCMTTYYLVYPLWGGHADANG